MATVSKSNLENIAQTKRDGLSISNNYNIATEYNEDHNDAKSNGDPNGKGSGTSIGYAIPEDTFSIDSTGNRAQKMNYSTIITKESGGKTIGGKYDREGRKSIPKSGREGLETINKYTQASEYGDGCIDTSSITLNMGKKDKKPLE